MKTLLLLPANEDTAHRHKQTKAKTTSVIFREKHFPSILGLNEFLPDNHRRSRLWRASVQAFVTAIGGRRRWDRCYQNVNWVSTEKFYFAVEVNGV